MLYQAAFKTTAVILKVYKSFIKGWFRSLRFVTEA